MCRGGEHSASDVIIFINFVSDLLLHGYEALLERKIQESVLSGHKFHHDVQPELHGGDQPHDARRAGSGRTWASGRLLMDEQDGAGAPGAGQVPI